MANYNPRRARIMSKEEKQMQRRIVLGIGALVALTIALFVGGVPLLLSLGNFINNIKGGNAPQASTNTNPLITPRLEPLDSATNSAKIAVTGIGQSNLTAELFVNDKLTDSQQISESGDFSFTNIQLMEGNNTIYIKAKSQDGRETEPSSKQQITYDKTPPKLEINNPQEGQTINGSSSFRVTGKTEPSASVTVNDTIATLGIDGGFSATIQLNTGGQIIKIAATDTAGNQTTVERSVTYNP